MNSEMDKILKIILGEDRYNDLLTLIINYFKDRKECTFDTELDDIEPIMNTCSIVIFLIGILGKDLKKDSFLIRLSSKRKMIVNMMKFKKSFSEYIKSVEDYKITLLNKILI